MHPGAKQPLLKWCRWIAVLVLLGSMLALLDPYGLFFDLLSHFKAQYLIVSLVLCLVFWGARQWRWAVSTGGAVCLNALAVMPMYFSVATPPAEANDTFKVIQANLSSSNQRYRDLQPLVGEQKPDFLCVQELTWQWHQHLQQSNADLPFEVIETREDNFGIGLYSRWPVRDVEIHQLGTMALPAITATADIRGRDVSLVVAHPPPPIGRRLYRERNQSLIELSELIEKLPKPVVVVGDLNTTPWNSHYLNLQQRAQLQDARQGHGILPTWPGSFWPLHIPLDHCLFSEGIAVSNATVGAGFGSDHKPLIVELMIMPKAN